MLRNYLQSNQKGKVWVKRYGIDKTVELAHWIFLPLTCALCIIGLFIGVRGLLIVDAIL